MKNLDSTEMCALNGGGFWHDLGRDFANWLEDVFHPEGSGSGYEPAPWSGMGLPVAP